MGTNAITPIAVERLLVTARAALKYLELADPDAPVTWDLKVALKGCEIAQRNTGLILLEDPIE